MMFLLFGVLIVVVGSLMMMFNGLTWSPFFLPLDVFLFVALYLLIILTILNFFFRDLEVRYNVRNSQKYLMARNSQRTALAIIIICTFLAVIVAFPMTATTANKILSKEGVETVSSDDGQFSLLFENQDRLGLFESSWVEVNVISGVVTFEICEKGDFQRNGTCDAPEHLVLGLVGNARYVLPKSGYRELVMVITNTGLGPSTFTYHIETNPSPMFVGSQPLTICLIFIISNSIWIAYLQPTRKRYASSSIYSEEYVAEAKAGTEAPIERAPVVAVPVGRVAPKAKKKVLLPQPVVEKEEPPPPPPLPAKAHPLPKGSFLNELIALLKTEGGKEQTEGFLRTLMEFEPMNKEALFHLGDMLQEEGRYESALNQYNRITKIDQRDEDAWVKRGDVLLSLGRDFEAVQSYREVLKINASNPEAIERIRRMRRENQSFMARAIDRSSRSDFEGAIELYDKILSRDPENIQALLGKGTMYRRLEKWPASLESLNKVLELDPDNMAALHNKAEVFENAMKWEEALSCYDEIIRRSPDSHLDWLRRGDVLFELDRTEEALESYRKAEGIKPDSERVKKRIRLLTAPSKEEIIQKFTKLPGIGKAKAVALFEAGYESIEDIREAGEEDIAKVKGISKAMAKKMKEHLED